MASSSKGKLDEKHLKILRELATFQHNKQCFDCQQRGPTYINMTIGSFVCTSCSGILRGIIPPHRVKSISMASFTADEIEFIKCHGNEFCRQVWLNLYDSRSMPQPDSREEQKIREFMNQKYEKKRWYMAPTESMKQEAKQMTEALLNSKQSNERSLKSRLGAGNSVKLTLNNSQMNKTSAPSVTTTSQLVTQISKQSAVLSSKQTAAVDLLGDLGGDIFSSPAPPANTAMGGGNFGGQSAFGDFATFHTASTPASVASQQTVPDSSDKYAALLDLISPANVSAPATCSAGLVNWTGMAGAHGTQTTATPSALGWSSMGTSSQQPSRMNWEGQAGMNWGSAPAMSAHTGSTFSQDWSGGIAASGHMFAPHNTGANPFVGAGQATGGGMNPYGGMANNSMFAGASYATATNPAWEPTFSTAAAQFQPNQFQVQSTMGAQGFPPQFGGMQTTNQAFPTLNGTTGYPGSALPTHPTQPFMKAPLQGQGFVQTGNWAPSVPPGNPFMTAALQQQQQMPPRANTNNPFL